MGYRSGDPFIPLAETSTSPQSRQFHEEGLSIKTCQVVLNSTGRVLSISESTTLPWSTYCLRSFRTPSPPLRPPRTSAVRDWDSRHLCFGSGWTDDGPARSSPVAYVRGVSERDGGQLRTRGEKGRVVSEKRTHEMGLMTEWGILCL